jgi:hypothetical protein
MSDDVPITTAAIIYVLQTVVRLIECGRHTDAIEICLELAVALSQDVAIYELDKMGESAWTH